MDDYESNRQREALDPMNVNIPPSSSPIAFVQDGKLMINSSWYRYFAQNDSAQIAAIKLQIEALESTETTQAAQITTLNSAISTIRDVALFAAVPTASEIPDLGRR